MTLDELFVNHKQVDPVSFTLNTPELPKNIYLNLERAQQVSSNKSEDISTWKVGNDNSSYDWKVDYGRPSITVPPQVETPTSSDYYTRLKKFIAKEEGFRKEAYKDGNYYSIGYGFNDPKYKEGDTMTKEEANAELDRQLRTREAKYKKRFGSKWDNLTDNQRIALMSYGYNTGDGHIINGDVAKYLDVGDMVKLRDSLKINTFKGKFYQPLEGRRVRERRLFDEH